MEEITVDSHDPIRLDRYLRRIFPDITQGVIEKALRNNKIKLLARDAKESKPVKVSSNTRIADGDTILIYHGLIGDFGQNIKKTKAHSPLAKSLAKKLTGEYLIHSQPEFFAINKPYGLAVQGGSKIKVSVDEALAYLNETESRHYKLVHRLDKETSGVLLIADGFENSSALGKAFKEQKISKKYLAKVSGCPLKPEGFLSNYIGKDRSGAFEIVKEQKDTGKLAETYYKIISSNGRSSLLELLPKTGRMHQLRCHCRMLGCPIIGDQKYGGIKYERMMLHALSLEIDPSVFGKKILIQAPLDSNDHLLFSEK
jgi:23S rRNA pseudouridine955/2504/2580 synthase